MEREGIHSLPTVTSQAIPEANLTRKIVIDINSAHNHKRSIEEAEERYKILTKQLKEAETIEDINELDQASIDALRRQLEKVNRQLDNAKQADRVLSTYDHRPILSLLT